MIKQTSIALTLLLSLGCSGAKVSEQRSFNKKNEKRPSTRCLNIVGGKEDRFNTFTGVVPIKVGDSYCSASLISKRTILTAAHCLDSSSSGGVSVLGNDFETVIARSEKVVDFGQRGSSVSPIKDAAILSLDRNLPLKVLPLDLRPEKDFKPMPVNIVGYGYSTHNKLEQQKNGLSGKRRIGKNYLSVIFEGHYWLMGANSQSSNMATTAAGDSGSPLLSSTGIIGITSGGSSDINATAFTKYYKLAPSEQKKQIDDAMVSSNPDIAISYFFKLNGANGQDLLKRAENEGLIDLEQLAKDSLSPQTGQSDATACN